MRHKFSPLFIILAAVFLLSSCLSNDDEDDTTYYEDTAISAFTLGTLNVIHHVKASDGVTDSTYTTTLTGSAYLFYIDQNNATIYNNDSLPVGTDTKHVLATISTVNSGTPVLNLYSKTGQDSLAYYSSTDSIDFTNPVRVRVYNMRATAYREYTIKVNVHKERPGTFRWNATTLQGLDSLTDKRFITLSDGSTYLLGTKDGIPNIGYRLTSNGWQPVYMAHLSNIPSPQLLIGGNCLYLADKDSIIRTDKQVGAVWTKETLDDNASNLPATDINLVAKESKVNSGTYDLVLIGNRDRHTVVWGKVEESDNFSNPWYFYNPDSYNTKTLPYLANLRAVSYDDKILATGGDFSKVYSSPDNGLTWAEDTTYSLPEGFGNNPGKFTFFVDANNIMYISKDGSNQLWSGRLARLGWKEQQTVFTRSAR